MFRKNLITKWSAWTFIIFFSIILLRLPALAQPHQEDSSEFTKFKTKLVCELINQELVQEHYSKKILDDNLSETIYKLYLKQIDPQKRFITTQDLSLLASYNHLLDDEIKNRKIEFPLTAEKLVDKHIPELQNITKELLAKDFSFYEKETFETDIEKIQYCNSFDELIERWKKSIKYQVEMKYLDLLEEEKASLPESIQPEKVEDQKLKDLRAKAREKVLKNYEEYFNRLLEKKVTDFYDGFFNAFANAFDPHSTFMPPAEKEDFDIHMRGSLEGIGARLRESEGYIQVVSIMPGGAADRQGQLEVDDIILKVAEASGEPAEISGMPIRDAVSLIRGKKGSLVRLTIKKTDASIVTIPIIRDVVQIEETFVKNTSLTGEENDRSFGYIKIPTFYRDFKKSFNGEDGRNSTDDVKVAIENLKNKNIQGIILDLRNNGGGALVDAVSIAGLFIKEGPIVQVKDAGGKIQVHADEDPEVSFNGPLVVLVNRISASASEILAGAIQDYSRGIIVGSDHTHGKGTVQTIIDLDTRVFFQNMRKYMPLGALKITIQKFYRINGDSVQYRGVVPDIILPDSMQFLEYGERYLENSLTWDKVQPTIFSKTGDADKKIAELQEKSKKRIQDNEIFREITEDAKRIEERRKQTLVSLNILDAWKERQEIKKQKKNKKWGGSSGFHGLGETGEEEDGAEKNHTKKVSPEERNALWIKSLQEDPYIKEAMRIMKDMTS